MADRIVVEEFHVTITVSPEIGNEGVEAIRRALNAKRFQNRITSAVRKICRRDPSLRRVEIQLSR